MIKCTTYWSARCDACGQELGQAPSERQQLEALLEKREWRTAGTQCFCANCLAIVAAVDKASEALRERELTPVAAETLVAALSKLPADLHIREIVKTTVQCLD